MLATSTRLRRLLLMLLASYHQVQSEPALPASAAVAQTELVRAARATVRITPPWPAPSYMLACTQESTQSECDALSRSSIASDCAEPEQDTAEVLASLLLGCDAPPAAISGGTSAAAEQRAEAGGVCVYVDIGCNLGYFAAQAAALGARVDCFEPAPFFVESIGATVRLNHGFERRLNVTRAAVAATIPIGHAPHLMRIRDVYKPCYIGKRDETKRGTAWIETPVVTLRSILQGRYTAGTSLAASTSPHPHITLTLTLTLDLVSLQHPVTAQEYLVTQDRHRLARRRAAAYPPPDAQ